VGDKKSAPVRKRGLRVKRKKKMRRPGGGGEKKGEPNNREQEEGEEKGESHKKISLQRKKVQLREGSPNKQGENFPLIQRRKRDSTFNYQKRSNLSGQRERAAEN